MYPNVVNSKCPSKLLPIQSVLCCQETNWQINKTKGNKHRNVLRRMREKIWISSLASHVFLIPSGNLKVCHGSHEPYCSMIYIYWKILSHSYVTNYQKVSPFFFVIFNYINMKSYKIPIYHHFLQRIPIKSLLNPMKAWCYHHFLLGISLLPPLNHHSSWLQPPFKLLRFSNLGLRRRRRAWHLRHGLCPRGCSDLPRATRLGKHLDILTLSHWDGLRECLQGNPFFSHGKIHVKQW